MAARLTNQVIKWGIAVRQKDNSLNNEGRTEVKTAKRRAVDLTPEALSKLNVALEVRCSQDVPPKRPTRGAKAEILGISLPTLDRILALKGVDRAILEQAFAAVGLDWDDRFLNPSATSAVPTPTRDTANTSSPPITLTSIKWLWLVGLLGSGLIVGASFHLVTDVDSNWAQVYDGLLSKATRQYGQGQYRQSAATLAEAMAVAEKHATSRDLEAALKLRGDIANARGRFSEAEEYYRATIRYRTLRNRIPWAPIHEVLGVVQVRLKKFAEAEQNLSSAYKAFSKNKEPNGVAEVLRDRGCLAVAMGRPTEALAWFAKSLEVLQGRGAMDMVVDVQGERAMALLALGQLEVAHADLTQCLTHWSRSGHKRWIGLTEMRLGKIENQMGKRRSAAERLTRASEHFHAVGDEARIAEVDALLGQVVSSR